MIRNATASAKAIWPKPKAVPRFVAPNSSASADTRANAPREIPIRAARVTVRSVRVRAAAHGLDDDAARALLEYVTRDSRESRPRLPGEVEVNHFGVAALRFVDDRGAHVAGPYQARSDLQLLVACA